MALDDELAGSVTTLPGGAPGSSVDGAQDGLDPVDGVGGFGAPAEVDGGEVGALVAAGGRDDGEQDGGDPVDGVDDPGASAEVDGAAVDPLVPDEGRADEPGALEPAAEFDRPGAGAPGAPGAPGTPGADVRGGAGGGG
jgi:hypothetical protein